MSAKEKEAAAKQIFINCKLKKNTEYDIILLYSSVIKVFLFNVVLRYIIFYKCILQHLRIKNYMI